MLSTYGEILRLNRAWRFSAAGFILRLPMSIMPISIILSIQAAYGNYTLAGVVSAINIIALAVTAPMWARLVDRYGQLKVMGPVFAVSAIATTVLLFATLEVASTWILFVSAGIAGATWGSPGALLRARWIRATDTVAQLNSAFALEAAVDEFVYIVGPVVATVLGTALHPTTGVAVSIVFLILGAALFLGQRSSEPVPVSHRSPAHGDEAADASGAVGGGKQTPAGPAASTPQRSLLLLPAMIVLMLTYAGMGAQFGANDIAVVAFTKELGVPALSGVLLALFSVGSLISALLYGARSWRHPLWKLFAVGVVALAIGMTAYLLANSLVSLGIIMLISGIACAPTMTNVNMMVTKSVPRHRQTEGLAWLSTAINLGVSLGSSASGPAVDRYGSTGAYVMIAIFAWLMVLGMLVGLPTLKRSLEKSAQEEAARQREVLDED